MHVAGTRDGASKPAEARVRVVRHDAHDSDQATRFGERGAFHVHGHRTASDGELGALRRSVDEPPGPADRDLMRAFHENSFAFPQLRSKLVDDTGRCQDVADPQLRRQRTREAKGEEPAVRQSERGTEADPRHAKAGRMRRPFLDGKRTAQDDVPR